MTTLLEQPATGVKTVWSIDRAHSSVEFSVRHMMVSTVKGQFGTVSGQVETIDENVGDASVSVEIDPATITTGNEQRDAHLKSPDFLDVEKYPAITFKSTGVKQKDAENFDLIGNLTIRGVTKEIVLSVTDNGRGRTPFGTYIAGFSGTTSFNRHDFGAKWNVALEAGGFLVGDTVKVSVEVEVIKQEIAEQAA